MRLGNKKTMTIAISALAGALIVAFSPKLYLKLSGLFNRNSTTEQGG